MAENATIEIRTGSDSDIPKIREVYAFFEKLGIGNSPRILSAHRTPERMADEAKSLEKKGFRVSIAGAGGSAHLAGMTASETVVPVVALPVKPSQSTGLDSLLSMINMPPGIPNGCVGINDAKSAAILATRIAYLDNDEIRERLSRELGTEITARLDAPYLNIITKDRDIDTSLLDRFGITYAINPQELAGPITVYVAGLKEFPDIIPSTIEQISIAAPTVNKECNEEVLRDVVRGPFAWMGVNRVQNAMIYAAQILGIYFPDVREKFRSYREELAEGVAAKDERIQTDGYKAFPGKQV